MFPTMTAACLLAEISGMGWWVPCYRALYPFDYFPDGGVEPLQKAYLRFHRIRVRAFRAQESAQGTLRAGLPVTAGKENARSKSRNIGSRAPVCRAPC